MRASDQILWESTVRGEAFRETKSDSLALYPRVFTPRRIHPALCEVDLDQQRHRSGQPDIRIVIDFT